MVKKVKLELPKDLTHIAGHELGVEICKVQIVPYLKQVGEVEIEIPEHVEAVAIGFVQGIKGEILKLDRNIKVDFKAKTKELEERMYKNYNY